MFTGFLDWFDRHKYGVVGTLMLHTCLMLAFALAKLRTPPPRNEPPPLVLQLEAPPAEPEQEQPKPEQEQDARGKVTNFISNSTADEGMPKPMSQAAQERMAKGIDEDLHAMERAEFDRLAAERKAEGKEIIVPKLDPSKFDKRNYEKAAPKPVKVKGLTTVSYDLAGRTDEVLEVPAYLCKGHGKVVVRVSVDRSGYVGKAEVDTRASTTTDDCMVDNAFSSASTAKFSSSSTAAQPQRGTITYIFLAQ